MIITSSSPTPTPTTTNYQPNHITISVSSSSGNVGNANGGNGSGGGAVTIYTTTTNEGVAGGGGNGGGGGGISGNISGGGPLQEIIVNPSSMVGWRLSANGSLIPPHDLLTGGLPNAATQKRGSERLFQYLEAEGSDPEDYARYLHNQFYPISVFVGSNLFSSYFVSKYCVLISLSLVKSTY